MDGPCTNWNILQLLQEDCKEKEHPTIISIGSHGLHVLHRAFNVGVEASGWDVGKVLKSMWRLLHYSPAGRDVFKGL